MNVLIHLNPLVRVFNTVQEKLEKWTVLNTQKSV